MKIGMKEKRRLVNEVLVPVMEEKGFEMTSSSHGLWEWKKEIDGVMEMVSVLDLDGLVSMEIGMSKGGIRAKSAVDLLPTLEHPRTRAMEWAYVGRERDGLYRDILLDMRDILLKNGEGILRENAEGLKKCIPNRRHFECLRDEGEELAEEYGERLGIDGSQDVLEAYDMVAERLRGLCGRPLEEVERDLIGLSALMEREVLRWYGGEREISEEYDTVMVVDSGALKTDSYNFMTHLFAIWKSERHIEVFRKQLEHYYEWNLKYGMGPKAEG